MRLFPARRRLATAALIITFAALAQPAPSAAQEPEMIPRDVAKALTSTTTGGYQFCGDDIVVYRYRVDDETRDAPWLGVLTVVRGHGPDKRYMRLEARHGRRR